jgi:DNA-binding transcriptional ArsR family regulator
LSNDRLEVVPGSTPPPATRPAGLTDVEVIDDPAAAIAALDPVRARVLAALMTEPGSATSLASVLDLPRQKVNYHLRTLEAHGLVRLVGERPRRGLVERLFTATARAYLVSPAALGDAAGDPVRRADRLSAQYLLALGARLVREVADAVRAADRAGKRLATLGLDTEIRFRSAAERAAFTAELTAAVTDLASRYHDESATGGRWHRLVVGAHPIPPPPRSTP